MDSDGGRHRTEAERRAHGGAPPGCEGGAHRRCAPGSGFSRRLARDRRAAVAFAERIDTWRAAVAYGTDASAAISRTEAYRRAECAAPGLGPGAPNDPRVRGAGPARKTLVRLKSMDGPASPAADC
jgi:hypothetical protein